jgi:hypothetical protein
MAKEGYKPTSGMQSAARRAIKWKEEGKAKGAGTAVGWTRAGQLSRGESLSLDTVKRMYSFFSRHEVDKKGKGFYDGPEFPSNGRIMWDAWGGDGGFSWSRAIVNREKKAGEMKKALITNDLAEEIKSILDDIVNPITIQKAVKPEVSKDTLLEVIKELQEIIIGMVEVEEEPEMEDETTNPENPMPVGNEIEDANNMDNTWPIAKAENMTDTRGCKCNGCTECKANGGCDMEMCKGHDNMYKSDNEEEDAWDNEMQKCWTGYVQRGMKDKGGRMVPNCVPVEKVEDLSEADQVKKSLWGGSFKPTK